MKLFIKRSVIFPLLLFLPLTGCVHRQSETSSWSDTEEAVQSDSTIQTLSPPVEVKNDAICIQIQKIIHDSHGYLLGTEIRNLIPQPQIISVQWAALDDVQIDPLFQTVAEPGTVLTTGIRFAQSDLERAAISDPSKIELRWLAMQEGDWGQPALLDETIQVFPHGEQPAQTPSREIQDGEIVWADTDQIRVLLQNVSVTDQDWVFDVCVQNKTEQVITCTLNNAAVNGIVIDPLWAVIVQPNKTVFSQFRWTRDQLAAYGLDSVETLQGNLTAHDEEDWLSKPLLDQEINWSA